MVPAVLVGDKPVPAVLVGDKTPFKPSFGSVKSGVGRPHRLKMALSIPVER